MYEAIVRAALKGDILKFESLLQGVDPAAVTADDHWNLLHRLLVSLTQEPPPEAVQKLIDIGVDVNAADRYGNTPLHYAARRNAVGLMGMLLDAGAAIDPVNEKGATPLRMMLAKKPHDAAAIELLLSRGADIDQSAPGGDSTKEYARKILQKQEPQLFALFEKYGH